MGKLAFQAKQSDSRIQTFNSALCCNTGARLSEGPSEMPVRTLGKAHSLMQIIITIVFEALVCVVHSAKKLTHSIN